MMPPEDVPTPNEKRLRIAPFALQAARGLVRDQRSRRMTMSGLVLSAVVLLFLGATFLAPVLDPHVRPGWFIFYWAVCAWITLTAVLLALFDLLIVRAEARAARRSLGGKLEEPGVADDEA